MTEALQAYIDATERSIDQIRDMISVEQEKRQALLAQDMEQLENVLQRQQAMLMQTENLEKKRLAAQETAGFAATMTGAAILSAVTDPADKAALSDVFTRLGDTAQELQTLNKTAMDIANMNVKIMERLTRSTEEKKAVVYKAGGQKFGGQTGGRSFLEEI